MLRSPSKKWTERARKVAIPAFLGGAAPTDAARERPRDGIGRLWSEQRRDRPKFGSSMARGRRQARRWGSAAARCARADGQCVSPDVQPLAASADTFSETFAPEQRTASQASAFLRYVAQGPCGRDVRRCTFGDSLVRHHVCPAAMRVRKGDRESGREGMPSFSAARIDASSRVPLGCRLSNAGTFKIGIGRPAA